MRVLYSAQAISDLENIWIWNAERHSADWADRYLAFVRGEIGRIATSPNLDSAVPYRSDLRYRVIRRRQRGHGHVVVYRATSDTLQVLHLFHSAQDWQGQVV